MKFQIFESLQLPVMFPIIKTQIIFAAAKLCIQHIKEKLKNKQKRNKEIPQTS